MKISKFLLICLSILLISQNSLAQSPFRPKSSKFPLNAPDSSQVELSDAFTGIRFNQPIFMTQASEQEENFYVVEQSGVIKLVTKRPNTNASSQNFANLRNKVSQQGGEMGLLGLAFAPDYETSGYFYVSYTADNPVRLAIARMRRSLTNPLIADPNFNEVILEIRKDFREYTNHNGGMISFGPDGMLYIGVGDGGGAGDPFNNSQNTESLWGKILRIDVNNQNTYSIPNDNPFTSQANYRPEIWALGLRNPWRFSFDKETQQLWLADVGQNRLEEINIIQKAKNYGWRIFEASTNHNNPENLTQDSFVKPVWEYAHNPGRSITGGYVYNGNLMPKLKRHYIYGDYVSGQIWALKHNDTIGLANFEIAQISQPSSFAQDLQGELYVISHTGSIYKLREKKETQPNNQMAIPEKLSEAGFFSNLETLTPVEGLEKYSVNSPLWSDGAEKSRWMALPSVGKIGFTPRTEWSFPVGTYFIKHFQIPLANGRTKRLETRVLFHHTEGWRGYTYKWNDEQNEAFLLDGELTEELLVKATPEEELLLSSKEVPLKWNYPSRNNCLVCHNMSAGFVLGAHTGQLNNSSDLATNFLERMKNNNLFSRNIGSVFQYQSLVNPYLSGASLELRSKSYLAANCTSCHSASGPAPGQMDFRYHIATQDMNIINVPSIQDRFEDTYMPYRVKAGDPSLSSIFQRTHSSNKNIRMPPISSNRVDLKATQIIHDWIQNIEENN